MHFCDYTSMKQRKRNKCKQYSKLLSILLKQSKQSNLTDYFQTNIYDLKSAWKIIKELVSLKEASNSMSFAVIKNNNTLTKPEEIAIEFKK